MRRGKHNSGATDGPKRSVAQWTFLSNHAHVLIFLARHGDAVLREVAAAVGITERAVQTIVTDLEQAGVLERTRVGRRNRYVIRYDAPLRHPIEGHRTVGDLVAMVGQDVAEAQGT
jgi:DNA-binding Lrp family transcriptional regulator